MAFPFPQASSDFIFLSLLFLSFTPLWSGPRVSLILSPGLSCCSSTSPLAEFPLLLECAYLLPHHTWVCCPLFLEHFLLPVPNHCLINIYKISHDSHSLMSIGCAVTLSPAPQGYWPHCHYWNGTPHAQGRGLYLRELEWLAWLLMHNEHMLSKYFCKWWKKKTTLLSISQQF